MRRLAALFLLPFAFLSSCKKEVPMISEELTVAQAEELIRSTPDLQIIDVRSLGEHKAGYIKGAKLIPIDQFEKRMSEVSKDKPALLYCAGGGRSSVALDILKKQGHTKAVHLLPGFDGWRQAGKAFVQ